MNYRVLNSDGRYIGRIDDDEYVRDGPHLRYRIDDNEVYDLSGRLLALIDGNVAVTNSGTILLRLEAE